VKLFAAILFSLLLLLLTPFASLQAASSCPPAKMASCCNASCHMACCAHRDSDSQSTPVVPPQKAGTQNQVSLLTLAVVVWSLPEHPASSISSDGLLPAMAARTPLYERNCALLL
jgi:hypothetical protein